MLYDLPTKTRTIELEKIFEVFDGASVAIRWFNDTSALAVFRNPSLGKPPRPLRSLSLSRARARARTCS